MTTASGDRRDTPAYRTIYYRTREAAHDVIAESAVQEQALRAWAKAHGHVIVAWYRDEGVPGSNGLDGRDGMRAKRKRMQAHK